MRGEYGSATATRKYKGKEEEDWNLIHNPLDGRDIDSIPFTVHELDPLDVNITKEELEEFMDNNGVLCYHKVFD